ncbi:PQQ-dependent sugar dehydrogenase [Pseudopedobacter sp.]|uniref:PQQ-dependent sugar dehydrogenase n=1 Tax=Pseudopedobacter sp. TaxID=1936787 RepID=UPI00333F1AE1
MNKHFLIFGLMLLLSSASAKSKTIRNIVPVANGVKITLPQGFTTAIIAENLGRPRHLTINPDGSIYVKLARVVDGKGILYLKDSNSDGTYEVIKGFGNYGGTGLYVKNGFLYASSNKEVFRYTLNEKNEVTDIDNPDKIITGLKMGRQHETKSIVIDNADNIYVNIGAYSNSCQQEDRKTGSLGIPGCPLLDSAGGIWQFKVNKLNQSYGEGIRYATGLRNVVGLDWNNITNSLFVMQHGRDQLNTLFPDLYDAKMNAELPAECLYELKKGDNAGWPFAYYDPFQKKNILAPEYGGDGKKPANGSFINPTVAFPAHLAPNGLLFYTGNQFPEKYRNGAFIAFHGSWNRTPEKQEGFYVAFVPFKNGRPSGEWEIFANGFSGSDSITSASQAVYRPCGLAQGPDGSLYITDDKKGTIFKITYNGK